MKKTEMVPHDVFYCDFCGDKIKGFDRCDICHRDMCGKHSHIMSSEENHYCKECGDKKREQVGLKSCYPKH